MATHFSGPVLVGPQDSTAGATGVPSNVFNVSGAVMGGALAASTGKQQALRFFATKPAKLVALRSYAPTAGGALSSPRLRVYVNGTVKGTATTAAGAANAKSYTLSGVMTGPANAWWGVGVATSGVSLATSLPGGLSVHAVFQYGYS